MRLFTCSNCGNPVHFDNRVCVNCSSRLGFDSDKLVMHALAPAGGTDWTVIGNTDTATVHFCANADHDICNWLVPAGSQSGYCVACSYNRIVPVADNPEGLSRWQKISAAQRHLFYSLLRWNLPRPGRDVDPQGGLVFDFLADEVDANGNVVQAAMTGHEDGLISLRAAEADDATREQIRVQMGEPYRTLLGHFRHEIGHWYFAQLCRDEQTLSQARALFGDEREDYAAALKRNYEEGPPVDWQNSFISTYASSHPAEDFAECWAHFFHIVDTLETARSFGLSTDPRRHEDMAAEVDFNPYNADSAQTLIDAWVPLSVALNEIQRSMGQHDSYPFILSTPVIEKLDFINGLIHRAGRGTQAGEAKAA